MAMRLATERETFSRIRRLPGLESSHIALQTMMGTDETVDFPDFLNGNSYFVGHFNEKKSLIAYFLCIIDPTARPDVPKLELHSQMEVKLGIM